MISLRPFVLRLFLLMLPVIPAGAAGQAPRNPPLFNLAEMENVPGFRWTDAESSIRSLIYEGIEIEGRATEVFAFYADPQTVGLARKHHPAPYPGVVLIHGGGGTAFAEWVDLWARRGYAAIAMDLSGRRPPAPTFDADSGALETNSMAHDKNSRSQLAKGGLDHTHAEKFASIATPTTDDDWPLHAVTNVVLAHSLLRSFEQVDADRTALTGISWGGYTTCLVASVDTRFKAAVPVYGCGFLHEGESVQKPAIDALAPADRKRWIDRYDPGSHLPNCRVPIFFVNGSNDVHYVLDSYAKSFDAVAGEKNIRIEIGMRHGHRPGWEPQEIAAFIDSHCNDGPPLARVVKLSSDRKRGLRATFESEIAVNTATLHYTIDDGLRSKRKWQSRPLSVDDKSKTIAGTAVPLQANTWLITLTDANGNVVSSVPKFQSEERR